MANVLAALEPLIVYRCASEPLATLISCKGLGMRTASSPRWTDHLSTPRLSTIHQVNGVVIVLLLPRLGAICS